MSNEKKEPKIRQPETKKPELSVGVADTEADFAMLYSEQLKVNKELIDRLHAVMRESLCYLNMSVIMIEKMLTKTPESPPHIVSVIKNLIVWRADLEAACYVNIFDPVTEEARVAPPISPHRPDGEYKLDDLFDTREMMRILGEASNRVLEHSDEVAIENNLATIERTKSRYKEQAQQMVEDTTNTAQKEVKSRTTH